MGIFDKKSEAGAATPGTAPQLATLKQKYQSVLNYMQQHQVQVKNVHVENGKLLIRGEAPSADVKNKVFDQIKLVDGTHADLTADITVAAGAGAAAGASGSATGAGRTYTVQQGDTLSKISKQYYGEPTSTCASSRRTRTS